MAINDSYKLLITKNGFLVYYGLRLLGKGNSTNIIDLKNYLLLKDKYSIIENARFNLGFDFILAYNKTLGHNILIITNLEDKENV